VARITIEADGAGVPAPDAVYERLETGDILYFPRSPVRLREDDHAFLLGRKQSDTRVHKNISYRPSQDRLKGVEGSDPETFERTRRVLRGYSRDAIAFVGRFLARYGGDWKVDFASFRPIEEAGRKVALRSRNDLIHVDSFPSRPSHGDRILRFFTNIHPERPRIWITSECFEQLAAHHAGQAGLPKPPGAWDGIRRRTLRVLSGIGMPVVDRPAYDAFMLRFHHYLKENAAFQRDCLKDRWEFPPGSAWMCFTDTTSHACPSGQFALEQTFLVRRSSLLLPDKAPIALLERLAGFPLEPQRSRSA
jgi:hypothetical protein